MLKNIGGEWQILAFRHPLAGFQLVKGTIETGESASVAVLRELSEEAGINFSVIIRDLGIWESGYENQIWALSLCQADGLPDQWTHHTQDGGGLDFSFFWHSLEITPDDNWHPIYQEALEYIKEIITLPPTQDTISG